MGPTNVALVKLFQADQALREAHAALDDASGSVRVQQRRINDLTEKSKLCHTQLRECQARGGQLELDVKSRDAHIEKLRTQQQNSKNHKEYQAFLTEINTEKIDKAKIEDELIKVMEEVEQRQAELKEVNALLEAERQKHAATTAQLAGRLAELQAEIDRCQPLRDAAAAGVPGKALVQFERLCERFEGESLAAIGKPDRRREEYVCTACNMDVVADIYNKLHSRDDLVHCPNCRRLLYIPDDLPPEMAINKPKERKETRGDKSATVGTMRQLSAADISRSISAGEEEEEKEEAAEATGPAPATEPAPPTEG